jgi:hypothetical protein
LRADRGAAGGGGPDADEVAAGNVVWSYGKMLANLGYCGFGNTLLDSPLELYSLIMATDSLFESSGFKPLLRKVIKAQPMPTRKPTR